jgi:predicted porin
VYGTVNMAFGNFKYSDGTAAQTLDGAAPGPTLASVSKWDVANGASNYGVRSRENLGGGLAGWVQIEQNAPLERSNNGAITPASRNSAIGIQGGFGNFFIGQWTTPWADLDALWGIGTVGFWGPVTSIIGRRETTGTAPNPNCSNNGQGVAAGASTCDAIESAGGVGHPFWRRFSNAIFYQSPVMSGVQVKLAYMTDEGKATANASTNADPSAYSASVQWAGMGGRARVGAAYDRHKDFTSIGGSDTGYALKGGWNFGVVDVGLAYETMKYKCVTSAIGLPAGCASDGDIKAKQYAVALAVPVGPGSIRASYSVAKDLDGSVGAAGVHLSDTGAKQYNVGYEHRFSKRTNIGVGYAKIDNKANAQFTWTGAPPNQQGFSNNPVFGSDVSTFFLSMTHRF